MDLILAATVSCTVATLAGASITIILHRHNHRFRYKIAGPTAGCSGKKIDSGVEYSNDSHWIACIEGVELVLDHPNFPNGITLESHSTLYCADKQGSRVSNSIPPMKVVDVHAEFWPENLAFFKDLPQERQIDRNLLEDLWRDVTIARLRVHVSYREKRKTTHWIEWEARPTADYIARLKAIRV